MTKVIIFKNHHLPLLKKAMSYPMKFAKGRVRNKFLALINDKHSASEKSRLEIVNKFCDKQKDGTPAVENGAYKISPDNQVKFNKEFVVLMNEEVIIDVLPSIEKDLGDIKQIINDTKVEFEEIDTGYLEDILEAIKNIGPLPVKEPAKKASKPKSK